MFMIHDLFDHIMQLMGQTYHRASTVSHIVITLVLLSCCVFKIVTLKDHSLKRYLRSRVFIHEQFLHKQIKTLRWDFCLF